MQHVRSAGMQEKWLYAKDSNLEVQLLCRILTPARLLPPVPPLCLGSFFKISLISWEQGRNRGLQGPSAGCQIWRCSGT